jgi:hypothetical protein
VPGSQRISLADRVAAAPSRRWVPSDSIGDFDSCLQAHERVCARRRASAQGGGAAIDATCVFALTTGDFTRGFGCEHAAALGL